MLPQNDLRTGFLPKPVEHGQRIHVMHPVERIKNVMSIRNPTKSLNPESVARGLPPRLPSPAMQVRARSCARAAAWSPIASRIACVPRVDAVNHIVRYSNMGSVGERTAAGCSRSGRKTLSCAASICLTLCCLRTGPTNLPSSNIYHHKAKLGVQSTSHVALRSTH